MHRCDLFRDQNVMFTRKAKGNLRFNFHHNQVQLNLNKMLVGIAATLLRSCLNTEIVIVAVILCEGPLRTLHSA